MDEAQVGRGLEAALVESIREARLNIAGAASRSWARMPGGEESGAERAIHGRWQSNHHSAMRTCQDCGACYLPGNDGCIQRFCNLLVVCHSRAEPRALKHQLAFAAFALQHPSYYERKTLEHSWFLLQSVFNLGLDLGHVTRILGAESTVAWSVPCLPSVPIQEPCRVTILDFGDFPTGDLMSQLNRWCRSAIDHWGGDAIVSKQASPVTGGSRPN